MHGHEQPKPKPDQAAGQNSQQPCLGTAIPRSNPWSYLCALSVDKLAANSVYATKLVQAVYADRQHCDTQVGAFLLRIFKESLCPCLGDL